MFKGHNQREGQRHAVTVYGRFRYNGRAYEVPLRDLSQTGCRFFDRHGCLAKGTPISLRIAGMGPFEAVVMWSADQYVGVRFDRPLYGPVLEHLATM
ncbi:hypothetical protein MACH05_14480 [Qipengyuania nanhaisediminis]